MIQAVGRIAAAVDLPVSADLEAGYGNAGETIRRAIGVGIVGANLEDEMRPFDEAVAAVAAAVRAADVEGVPFALNARTDAFLRAGDRDREAVTADAIERGRAFLDAGATCVFVPGKLDNAADGRRAWSRASATARSASSRCPGRCTQAELTSLGVARISFGPWSQRVALTAWADTATELLGGASLPAGVRRAELTWFRRNLRNRRIPDLMR